jgi:hypothetical protein
VKSLKLSVVLLATLTFSVSALSRLVRVYEAFGGMEMHALMRLSEAQSMLISTSLANDGTALQIRDFTATGNSGVERVRLPFALAGLVSQSAVQSKHVLVAGWDAQGTAQLVLIDRPAHKTSQSLPMTQFSHVSTLGANAQGFWVGGTSSQRRPTAALLDQRLTAVRLFELATAKSGELSSFLQIGDRILALANFEDATAALYDLPSTGSPRNVFAIPGGAANGINLSNGNIALSYRSGQDIFLLVLDPAFRALQTTHVLRVIGVSTRTPILVEFKGKVIWIGGNEGKLTVHSFTLRGSRSDPPFIDEAHGYNVPHGKSYLASVVRGKLYIQGQSLALPGGPPQTAFAEFKFVLDR